MTVVNAAALQDASTLRDEMAVSGQSPPATTGQISLSAYTHRLPPVTSL